MAQGGICLPFGDEDFVDGDSGPQGLNHGIAALDDAVVFLFHRCGAAQWGTFVHKNPVLPMFFTYIIHSTTFILWWEVGISSSREKEQSF